MISDGSVSGEGWYVDDVHVSTLKVPYSIAFEDVTPFPGKVEISWRVDPHLSLYTGQGMALVRLFQPIPPGDGNAPVTAPVGSFGAAGQDVGSPRREGSLGTAAQNAGSPGILGVNSIYELIYRDTSRSIGVHSFVDTMVVSGRYYQYFIRDVSSQGDVNYIEGPRVFVPYGIHSVSLAVCWPNPYVPKRGKLGVTLEIPDGPEGPIVKKARVAVFDVTGRMIAVLLDDRVPSGSRFASWDGTDSDGNTVAGGIYIISLDTADAHFSRKLVVLR
jgi:hypothetical protein